MLCITVYTLKIHLLQKAFHLNSCCPGRGLSKLNTASPEEKSLQMVCAHSHSVFNFGVVSTGSKDGLKLKSK